MAREDRCQAALLLDLDPVRLVRGPRGANPDDGGALRQYVNDRPYVASSFLSVAIARVLRTGLSSRKPPSPLRRRSRCCPAAEYNSRAPRQDDTCSIRARGSILHDFYNGVERVFFASHGS